MTYSILERSRFFKTLLSAPNLTCWCLQKIVEGDAAISVPTHSVSWSDCCRILVKRQSAKMKLLSVKDSFSWCEGMLSSLCTICDGGRNE